MKNLILSFVLIFSITCNGYSQKNIKQNSSAPVKVMVYFFHGTHRCTGCINAEKATIAALNKLYKSQQGKGIIKFQSLNIEESKNKSIAEKYQVAWNMLLIVPSNSKKKKVELTEQAFTYGTNPEGLMPYIKSAIEPMLK